MRTQRAPHYLAPIAIAATLCLAACGGGAEDAGIPEFDPDDFPPVVLTIEESDRCSDLRAVVAGLSAEIDSMESSELQAIADQFHSFADAVDDEAMTANATNIAEHFANASEDPSNYESGSPNAVSVFNDINAFSSGCREGWNNANKQ